MGRSRDLRKSFLSEKLLAERYICWGRDMGKVSCYGRVRHWIAARGLEAGPNLRSAKNPRTFGWSRPASLLFKQQLILAFRMVWSKVDTGICNWNGTDWWRQHYVNMVCHVIYLWNQKEMPQKYIFQNGNDKNYWVMREAHALRYRHDNLSINVWSI